VTLLSLFLRVGTFFWAGIFEMGVGSAAGKPDHHPLLQNWRQSGYLDNSTTEFTDEVKAMAISRALYSYPQIPGWQTGSYVFPMVELTPNRNYTISLQGLRASLDCSSMEADVTKESANSEWSATLTSGDCAGTTWSSACSLPEVGSDDGSNSGTIEDGQCMTWRYLDEKDCSQLQASDTGRWWIFGLSGSISTTDGTFTDSSISQNHMSLLCKPKFYLDTIPVNIAAASDPKMSVLSITEPSTDRQDLPYDRWKNGARTFATYASELINNTLAGELQVISYTTYLDLMSSIAALNLTSSTDGLFKAETLATSASDTFAALIATMVSIDQPDSASPFSPAGALLSPVTTPTSVSVSDQVQVAYLQKGPLYVGFVALCLFTLSIVFVWPSRARRTPNDVSYPANVLALVYDSGLMGLADRYNEKEMAQMIFTLGEFEGISRKRRLGIYVVGRSRGV
jgi:hypothetical protein